MHHKMNELHWIISYPSLIASNKFLKMVLWEMCSVSDTKPFHEKDKYTDCSVWGEKGNQIQNQTPP
jgi:hypothetical protein